MSLATGGNYLWICTLYYIIDEEINFYFISSPASKHVSEIQKNNQVAVSIAYSNQPPNTNKTGIQMQGIVEEVKGIKKLKWFFEMWKKINPSESKLTFENFNKEIIKSRVYQIKPTLIKYMNKGLFGNEVYKIYKF